MCSVVIFQSELDTATITALPRLKQSISYLFQKHHLTLAIAEGSTYNAVTDVLISITGSDQFLLGALYCHHPLSYVQLMGVSPAIVKNQSKDPKLMVKALLNGIKKRIRASLYCVVYNVPGQSQFGLGFQFSDHIIVKLVPFEGDNEQVKQKILYTALTYLKTYLVLYDKKEMPVMEEFLSI